MKKILAIAVSVAAFPALATTWTSAQGVRDALDDVYDNFDGTFHEESGGDEYAELLYRIDNMDDTITGITLSINPSTGLLEASGGSADGGFSLEEVLEQVDTFIAAVNEDMFGTEEAWDKTDYDADVSVETNSGFAGTHLNRIVEVVSDANDVLTDAAATREQKQAVVDWFYDGGAIPSSITTSVTGWAGFDGANGEAAPYNSAVQALTSIAEGIGSVTESSYSYLDGFDLGGTVETTYSNTGYDDGGSNIPHPTDNTRKFFDSYTDYVADNASWRRRSYTLQEEIDGPGTPTDISVSNVPAYVQFENTNEGDNAVTISSSVGTSNNRRIEYNPGTNEWSFNGGTPSGTFSSFQDAVNRWVNHYAAPDA